MADFYNGNPLLKKARIKISWTHEQVQEWLKCSQDPIYFAEKYIQIVHVDHGLIPIRLYDYQKDIIHKITTSRRVSVCTSRQAGKAISLDTELPLYGGGFKTMRDVVIGDLLIGRDGKPTKITFKSEIHDKPTYVVSFEDGTSVICCEDHLWPVVDTWNNNKEFVLDTKTILKSYTRNSIKKNKDGSHRNVKENRYAIINTKPAQYQKRNLLINPYILGVWLGDGASDSGKITCSYDDLEHYKNNGIEFTTDHSYETKNVFTSTVVGLHTELKKYNLIQNKHIPEDYLYSSIDDRLALLQGILDSDGTIDRTGKEIVFTQKEDREVFNNQVKQIMESLGLTVRVRRKYNNKYNRYYTNLSTCVSSDNLIPFRIKRKVDRLKKSTRLSVNSRRIIDITQTENKPTQCITVDNADHIFLCGRQYVPTHNTTTAAVIILHYILFNSHKEVALLANKGDAAREILERVKLSYESLPDWLQSGVVEWNKGNIELENGCKVLAAATSSSAIRGRSISFLYIDEAAFVDNWVEFFASVFPTISSGKTTKVLFTSTPNGLNHFYSTCMGAQAPKDSAEYNGYEYIEVPWQRVPGRDEKWRHETLSAMNFDMEKFSQEFECNWIGSSGTLISGAVLKTLVGKTPIHSGDGLNIYEEKIVNHQYVVVCDVSRGKGLDYSAFQLIDVTNMPYKQVCTFRSNMITPLDYAGIIFRTAKVYNNATVLVEINDIGAQVADSLHFDYEYEGIVYTENAGARGKRISTGFNRTGGTERGIRTTKTVKSVGCSMLKLLVEQRQIIINDTDTIFELSRFSKKGVSYEAESGCTDDLAMGLVLFGWMSDQQYFRDLTDINTLIRLRDKTEEELENELDVFFMNDGREVFSEYQDNIVDLTENPSKEFMFF